MSSLLPEPGQIVIVRQRPFVVGWYVSQGGVRLRRDTRGQAMARRARTLRAAGLSLQAIGRRLASEGFAAVRRTLAREDRRRPAGSHEGGRG